MMVLSRKKSESVIVSGRNRFERLLKVTVLEVRGGKVRLGFEVNEDFPVHAWEVWERIRAGGRSDRTRRDRNRPGNRGDA